MEGKTEIVRLNCSAMSQSYKENTGRRIIRQSNQKAWIRNRLQCCHATVYGAAAVIRERWEVKGNFSLTWKPPNV